MEKEYLLFEKSEAQVRKIYDKILHHTKIFGPLVVEVKKTSIHIKSSSAFAGIHPKKKWLDVNVISNKELKDERISKTQHISKNRFHNYFKLSSVEEVDKIFLTYLEEAYILRK